LSSGWPDEEIYVKKNLILTLKNGHPIKLYFFSSGANSLLFNRATDNKRHTIKCSDSFTREQKIPVIYSIIAECGYLLATA
jgi:hypothetical protein